MIKGLDSRFPDLWSHVQSPSLPRWGLSQKFPRPPWTWRDLSVLQTLPYFYTSFSELWVIARGYRSERNSGGSVLGAGHRDRLAQGSPGPVREDSASLCPALSWHALREQDFYWTLHARNRKWAKRDLGLISQEMDRPHIIQLVTSLIYCPL